MNLQLQFVDVKLCMVFAINSFSHDLYYSSIIYISAIDYNWRYIISYKHTLYMHVYTLYMHVHTLYMLKQKKNEVHVHKI